jgi:hypothetical protein
MRILVIALAAATLLSLAGLAEAMTLNGVGNVPTATRDYSPVEKVGCGGPGRCPYGAHWVCGPYGGCGCVSCGYARPYAAPYVARPYVAHPYVYHPYARRYRY